MYSIGDKIVYPMHGAGIIQDLEERQIDGEKSVYYVLNIPVGNLTVTISSKKASNLGIRYASNKEEVIEVLDNFSGIPSEIPENWNKRYEYNLQKIKSGELSQVLEVYISTYIREREKSLSGMEKKLLFAAKQAIVSELIVSQNIERQDAEAILRDTTNRFCPLEVAI